MHFLYTMIARVLHKKRENFMSEPVFVPSAQSQVACDGGGVFGHPKIYLTFGISERIVCPYCSRQFLREQKL